MPKRPRPALTIPEGLTAKAVMLMIALAAVIVAMAVVLWGLPALVLVALVFTPVMFVWFYIISRP